MPDRNTVTVQAAALPPEFMAHMHPRPLPSARVRVTLEEIEPTPEEWLEDVRAKLDEGLADIEAGRVVDGETFFAELRAKHFPKSAK